MVSVLIVSLSIVFSLAQAQNWKKCWDVAFTNETMFCYGAVIETL